jgi:hypothetical protein
MQQEENRLTSEPASASIANTLRARISDAHPIWDTLTKLAAPAAVAISAGSYLSGFTYRYVLFNSFGFRPGVIDQSVQDTIATGYIGLSLALISVAVIFMISGAIGALLGTLAVSRQGNLSKIIRQGRNILKPLVYINVFNGVALLMLIGVGAGGLLAIFDVRNYKQYLLNNCVEHCMYYRLTSGQLRGVVLGQSKDYTILINRHSAYLLQTSQIKSASPIYFRREWSQK